MFDTPFLLYKQMTMIEGFVRIKGEHMYTRSIILNKTYDSDKVIYMENQTQFKAYILNNGGTHLMDIIPDPSKGKIIYVFEKCDETASLYKEWRNHTLNYEPVDSVEPVEL